MLVAQLSKKGGPFELVQRPIPEPGAGQVHEDDQHDHHFEQREALGRLVIGPLPVVRGREDCRYITFMPTGTTSGTPAVNRHANAEPAPREGRVRHPCLYLSSSARRGWRSQAPP